MRVGTRECNSTRYRQLNDFPNEDTSGTHGATEKTKTPDFRGFWKRMKGLEPSTFCMASRRSTN